MNADVLLRTMVATLVAVAGGGLGILAAGGAKNKLAALVGLASGALLAITVVSLLPEAAHDLPPHLLVMSVAVGYSLFYLVGKYVYPVCPACAEHEMEARLEKPHSLSKTALLLGVALSLHAVADGIAVASSETAVMNGGNESLPMLIAISLHKLPEGLALVTLLLSAGIGRGAAFWATALVESMTLLGGYLGQLSFIPASPLALGLLTAHLAGSFLYLVMHSISGAWGTREGRQTQTRYGALGLGGVALLLWFIHHLGYAHEH
jgi:ZIP family zinc transporter/zinc and cadmium transporter